MVMVPVKRTKKEVAASAETDAGQPGSQRYCLDGLKSSAGTSVGTETDPEMIFVDAMRP
jgi:hypothetical protein